MFALEMIHYIFYFTYLETVTAFNFKLSGGYIRQKVTLIFMKPAISTPTVKEKKPGQSSDPLILSKSPETNSFHQ